MSNDVTSPRASLSVRVAEEIRVAMVRRRTSGAALAKSLGVSPAWISYRLTGHQEIGLDDLEAIAAALGVEVVDLLPRVTVKYPPIASTAHPGGLGAVRPELVAGLIGVPLQRAARRTQPTGVRLATSSL